MKYQKGNSNNMQTRARFMYIREKVLLAKYCSIKLWKKLFIPVEHVLETNIQKSQLLRMTKTKSTDEDSIKEQRENSVNRMLYEQYYYKYEDKSS
jgi:hypothetical protein